MNIVKTLRELPTIERLLDLLRETTGLRVALVAHVTDTAWTCCAIRDSAGFGLSSGDTLAVATTY